MSLTSLCYALLMVILVTASLSLCQLDMIRALLGLTHVQGTLYCTLNGNMGLLGLATPTFPNAAVQMQCGAGTVISSVRTDAVGSFSILVDAPRLLLSFLLDNCSVVVTTPLSNCNAGLPEFGSLASPLQILGSTFLGLFNVTNIIPESLEFGLFFFD